METTEKIKDGGPCRVDRNKASWAITLVCVAMLETPNRLPRFVEYVGFRGRMMTGRTRDNDKAQ